MACEDVESPALAEHFASWLRLQPEDSARRMLHSLVRDLQLRDYTDKNIRELVDLYLLIAGGR
jgi:elongation factor P--beta-lysine ligase